MSAKVLVGKVPKGRHAVHGGEAKIDPEGTRFLAMVASIQQAARHLEEIHGDVAQIRSLLAGQDASSSTVPRGKKVKVTVPPGMKSGQFLTVNLQPQGSMKVSIPEGIKTGDSFEVLLPLQTGDVKNKLSMSVDQLQDTLSKVRCSEFGLLEYASDAMPSKAPSLQAELSGLLSQGNIAVGDLVYCIGALSDGHSTVSEPKGSLPRHILTNPEKMQAQGGSSVLSLLRGVSDHVAELQGAAQSFPNLTVNIDVHLHMHAHVDSGAGKPSGSSGSQPHAAVPAGAQSSTPSTRTQSSGQINHQERQESGEDSGDESKVGWFWDEKMLRSSARKWAASRGYPEVLLEDLDETVNLVKQRQISEQEIVLGPSIDSGDVLSLIVSEWLSCCRCCTPTCSSARILPFGFT